MKNFKNSILTILLITVSIVSYGQIIEYDTYDGPLASGKTTGKFLMFAIGFGILGLVLLKLSDDKEKIMSKPFSYLGILAFFFAILCLLPLFAWIEVIGNIIIKIGLVIVIIVFAISLISKLINNRNN